jgi:signal transduction histidine kinase
MRSLKAVLITWTTVGVVTIFVAASVVLYLAARAGLIAQFDRSLLEKARFLAAATEQSAGELRLEFDEFDWSSLGEADDSAYVQVWLADGTTVYRSANLHHADLEPRAAPIDTAVCRWVDLPHGQTGRAVGITFTPRQEDRNEDEPEEENGQAEPAAPLDRQYVEAEGAELVISEFLAANNSVLADEDGESSDWIEIHNRGHSAVDLEGWYLTNLAGTLKWRFPKVTIQPGGFLLVFASGKDRRKPSGELHTNFRLRAGGEYLALIRPDGRTIESAYTPHYPPQVADVSYGLSEDGSRPGYFRRPTPGRPNDQHQTEKRPRVVSEPITLVLGRDAGSIGEMLVRLEFLLLLIGVVTVPALIAVLWLAVRRSLRSLDRLAGQISQLREQDLSERVDVPRSPKELRPVIDRLNHLLQQLDAAFRRERGLSADIAHELRTPLAGLLLKMDLVLSQVRHAEEYDRLVADCRTIVTQMQGMVENLLSLSRLEAGRIELHYEPVLMNEVIHDCWSPLAKVAEQRGVTANWSLASDTLLVTDRAQIGVAIRNLLENAVTHVNQGGSVSVVSSTDDGTVRLEVRNSGSLLTEEDANHVFERFWRGDTARSGGGIHCGLGLSLTSRIVTVLGGSVAARSSLGGDFEILVTLPISRDQPRDIP